MIAAVAGDCAKTLGLSRGNKPTRLDTNSAAKSTATVISTVRGTAPALELAGPLDPIFSNIFPGR